jgi:hypothetical protein
MAYQFPAPAKQHDKSAIDGSDDDADGRNWAILLTCFGASLLPLGLVCYGLFKLFA